MVSSGLSNGGKISRLVAVVFSEKSHIKANGKTTLGIKASKKVLMKLVARLFIFVSIWELIPSKAIVTIELHAAGGRHCQIPVFVAVGVAIERIDLGVGLDGTPMRKMEGLPGTGFCITVVILVPGTH